MDALYQEDLAYIHAKEFGKLACGAAPEIIRLLREASTPVRRVVDVGCGAGPLTAALTDAGFEVTGIDISSELLEVARAAVPAAEFIHGSVYEIQLPPCEAIVAVGEPLTYHTENNDADSLVESFFRSAAHVLPAGGMLIFDVIETGEPPLAGRFWSSGEDWAVLAHTEEEQNTHTLVRHIETFRRVGTLYRRGCETHRVQLFGRDALCSRLAACGFSTKTVHTYGSQLLGPRRCVFIATRIQHR